MSDVRNERINNLAITGAISGGGIQSLAQAVSVQMTAATSGSNGIQQLDNDNLDMGTNDFTIRVKGALPDYTPAANTALWVKSSGIQNLLLGVYTTGFLRLFLNQVEYSSTVNPLLTDGKAYDFTVVVIRESASVAGSITFYVNGTQVGAAVAIPAGVPNTVSTTTPAYTFGTATTRSAGTFFEEQLLNRALTAAEVLDISINGPALADIGASQTNLSVNGDFETWTTSTDPATWSEGSNISASVSQVTGGDQYAGTYSLQFTGNGNPNSTTNNALSQSVFSTSDLGRRVRFTIAAKRTSGTGRLFWGQGSSEYSSISSTSFTGAWQVFTLEYVLSDLSSSRLREMVIAADPGVTFQVDAYTVQFIGVVSELLASNAQSNTGQIFDSSGNKNHALLPASGATVVGRPMSQTREVRWTNTWAGTNELQYIGGVNQAILPANAYIESIIGTVSGTTPHDIIIGDGSDTDRYVTITTGLAAGTTSFTLANRTTDGTNLKLTIDPDTNATMSIAWVIRYSTLES